MQQAELAGARSRGEVLVSLLLLWLSGTALRITVLAVPPVILLITDDLHLNGTELGLLAGLPLLLFAVAAVPGSLLIARFGAIATLLFGLLLTAVGGALRGVAPDALMLFATTILMGIGVAIMQPSLPPLVRAWLPERIGLATAVYTNGLLLGEILVVGLTKPFILPLVSGNWRPSVAIWSLPVVATALFVLTLSPRGEGIAVRPSAPKRWWPSWRDLRNWQLGLVLGSVNAIYFAANQFLPGVLAARGLKDQVGTALTVLNFCQLLASAAMLLLSGQLVFRRWAYSGAGLLALGSVVGIVAAHGPWLIIWAGVLGFAAAVILILVLALPPSLCPPDDVHRMTAAMFTVSYGCAVAVSLLAGMAVDATGTPTAAFLPIGLCGLVTVLVPATIDFSRRG